MEVITQKICIALQVHHPLDKLFYKRRMSTDEEYSENGVLYDFDDGLVPLRREFDRRQDGDDLRILI